ncbi:hypothetical protein ACIA59_20100 [Micromonospora haikouensis]|uniref:hypothetical protein n=1 Tax=Micromonospora haikouensis TaxID=686309 RepID=UPI0037BAB936
MNRRTIGISVAGLALAAGLGVVAGAQLGDGTGTPRETVVRQVSDEGTVTPAAAPSPTTEPTASAAAEKTKPAPKSSNTRTNARSKVTDTDPEPSTEPPAPPGNSAPDGVETPPAAPAPPPPPGMGCLPQEVGVNPRCPATSGGEG